ncbi:Crp/Fnr family transcriptional regulator [Thiohalophilus thiocyanatoxydans]|uniref:CRP-like cAMP-binding protein n=1 Tax=Thiohalophilus thiocyanatoxydans TaxID=381308 RepID=A0A4R8ILU1_9GAMM|nr:Crp/Fnr family transcriptional regulator [Thiohalophilus thiocyanatoxydans]TDY01766.1 CRP-like cAMP-binding protein [Thiohalophilus thiocyanatoxydans]
MSKQALPIQNRLLNCLPQEVQSRLSPKLEIMSLRQGTVLHEAAANLAYIYFPIDNIVSLLHVLENGSTAEVAVIGNEGMIGVSAFMGGQNTQSQALVLTSGIVYRLSIQKFKEEFNQPDAIFRMQLLRYSQALITQMAQTVVCNRHHTIVQQLSRWLLMAADCLSDDDITMTHELIANLLGVRREGITAAAHKLKDVGAIEYRRGHIKIADRLKLEKLSCECYFVVKRETDRLLPCPSRQQSSPARKSGSRAPVYSHSAHAPIPFKA